MSSRLFLIFVAVAAPLGAQVDAAPRVGVSLVERTLSLADAIALALKNNLDLEVEKTNLAGAAESVRAAEGFYDFRLLFGPNAESRALPSANTLFAPDGRLVERFFNTSLGVQQPTRWRGMSLHAEFDNGRQSTTNPFTGLTPFVTSRLNLGATLPLARGRLTDQPRSEIVVRRKLAAQAGRDYELKVIEVITRVQNNYWDLVAAREDAMVKEDGVRWGREQLARNQRMIAAGTLAPLELAAAEAELQRRLDSYMAAIGLVTEVENALKLALAAGREDPLWGERIVPGERQKLEPAHDDYRAAVKLALTKRPELELISLRLETNQVQQELARELLKPQVNLFANFANAGTAGTVSSSPNPFSASSAAQSERLNLLSVRAGLAPLPALGFGGPPANFVGGLGQSWVNLFGGNYQTVQGGLQIEWNPRNSSAEANLAQTAIGERRLKLLRQQLEQAIEAQVRNALQALETSRQRIEAARAGERAAREKLESEERLFQTGESTNFLVLTRQNELLDSRRRSVAATLDSNRAVARLQQALGTTLEANQVRLAQ